MRHSFRGEPRGHRAEPEPAAHLQLPGARISARVTLRGERERAGDAACLPAWTAVRQRGARGDTALSQTDTTESWQHF